MRNHPGFHDHASKALKYYVELLPWMDLNQGIKDAMKDTKND